MNDERRAWVAEVLGSPVHDVRPIGKGASRRIWRVALADGRALVVREDTGDGPVAGTALDLAREAAVYRALGPTAVPLPRLEAVSPDGDALLLELVAGTPDVDADSRLAVSDDLGRQLGCLHGLDPRSLDLGPIAGSADDLALWRSIAADRTGSWATPAARAGLEWLGDRTWPPPTSLCHGDAGPGNFLCEGAHITALLDWEFAHLGDPHDDLAWVAVRNQVLGSPLDLRTVFGAWPGVVDHDLLERYRVFVLVRMLISCDASMSWAGGVEVDANRTQSRLRPLLAHLVCQAAASAGDPLDPGLAADAERIWKASPLHARVGGALDLVDLGAVVA